MSLLLDARKKTRQAQQDDIAQDVAARDPDQAARNAGRNLFAAKSQPGIPMPARGLLAALAATFALVASALGYLWHLDSVSGATISPRPLDTRIALSPPITETPLLADPVQIDAPTPATIHGKPATVGDMPGTPAIKTPQATDATVPEAPPSHRKPAVRIERPRAEAVDPLLADAYQSYREGRLDEARQRYLALLDKGGRDTDALLGLAAIAQHDGENFAAAQYYARVLALDPRNAVANAGMSALDAKSGERDESRLKTLLREQPNAAPLHFALGNLYAEQSRWGEAQQAYFNAWTLAPENAGIAYNLAVSLDHLGQAALAARYYQRALQSGRAPSPDFDRAWVERRLDQLSRTDR